LQLFDLLNKMPIYDKEKVITNLKNKSFVKHFEVKKHNLLQLLLDSQRRFRDVKLTDQNVLIEIDILIEKELFELALKRIKMHKKIAEKTENYYLEIELIQKELQLVKHIPQLDEKQLWQDLKSGFIKIENLINYRSLLNELYIFIDTYGFVRNSKQDAVLRKFKKNKILNDPAEAKSFMSSVYFNQINYIVYASMGENEIAYDYAKTMYNLLKKHTEVNGLWLTLRVRSIIARISALFLKGYDFKEFKVLIAELENIIPVIKDPELKTDAMSKYYQYMLLSFHREKRVKDSIHFLKQAIDYIKLKNYREQSRFVNYLRYTIGEMHFIMEQYEIAEKWYQSIYIPRGKEKINDTNVFSKIMILLCQIFKEETENIKYNANYLRKKLSKQGILYEFESFLISRISNEFINYNSMSQSQQKELFVKFRIELETKLSNKWKKNSLLYFDFLWWSDEMIKKLS
jgi:hypothetical protein